MVLLYHHKRGTGTMVGLAEGVIAGEHSPARRYVHTGRFLEVDGGGSNHIMLEDVEELFSLGYRLATPQEQEQYRKRMSSRIVEKGE